MRISDLAERRARVAVAPVQTTINIEDRLFAEFEQMAPPEGPTSCALVAEALRNSLRYHRQNTTGELFAFGMNVTVTLVGILTEV